jgi:dihydrofolate reductase
MRPLRYSINVTLDGCCHHEAGVEPDEELMGFWTERVGEAGALRPWEVPFAEAIDSAKKHVVSSTLTDVDWNAELVRGDLGEAVQRLKDEPGEGLSVGGVTLPLALADLGLIDEYELVVHPVLAGHGPTLLAGLRARVRLELVDRREFGSGAVALRYRPAQATA